MFICSICLNLQLAALPTNLMAFRCLIIEMVCANIRRFVEMLKQSRHVMFNFLIEFMKICNFLQVVF